MTEYIESQAAPGDTEDVMLSSLAQGQPYVFVVATSLDPLELRAQTSHDRRTARALLSKTLEALPE